MRKVIINIPYIPNETAEFDSANFHCIYSINNVKYGLSIIMDAEEFAELEQKQTMGTLDNQVSQLTKRKLMYFILQRINDGVLPNASKIDLLLGDIEKLNALDERLLNPFGKWEFELD